MLVSGPCKQEALNKCLLHEGVTGSPLCASRMLLGKRKWARVALGSNPAPCRCPSAFARAELFHVGGRGWQGGGAHSPVSAPHALLLTELSTDFPGGN